MKRCTFIVTSWTEFLFWQLRKNHNTDVNKVILQTFCVYQQQNFVIEIANA